MKFIFLFAILLASSIFAKDEYYTIAICTTSTLDYAKACQDRVLKTQKQKAFIVKENDKYYTNLNIYKNRKDASFDIKSTSNYIKAQGAFPRNISLEIVEKFNLGNYFIDLDKNIDNNIEEDLYNISLKEFDKQKSPKNELRYRKRALNSFDFDELIIKVNSKTNIMELFSRKNNQENLLRSYIVATGKNSIKKPQGEGTITAISLNPVWYPTSDTKKSFEKRGITLPDVVPPGHKYNYMGEAKLNLSHIVDGNATYRIHGTLNEKTLGYNVSAGCIRMKNKEVIELANLIEDFSIIYGMNKVRVLLD
ncbi:putative L,D-transpeptidase YnhG precursor [Aliarcobacter thereius]|uniref:L,D-transpeptidase n=2 Tax=Aliarcobacter thereius TaxID=544718 RepID=A0A1C0B8C6_9BACT|nr:L,D-transpeptidase [Aliarcobacter thereius]OCL87607.1 putative L,D-transpeptidase YnhG precursor [Aliarcobacter thereius]OCL93851.1 putative L,D-transpeptidase YnhG precursor [Aliarcobacter thereius]OCL95259.1 putative L,D-transpeptidase YnhG precursor [Aliarcobacter thereius LMG 24486]OCL99850.1 putative L,D-transpeptidase YnhG precursor [Aliarcobacter thereius]QBF16751.1 putative lipoprotein-anchoring transpeptidase, ErfK/SrfK family [Aliarcobacter thereius LMG 24486]